MKRKRNCLPAQPIEAAIHVVRDLKVILDCDLALLYGVPVKRLNEQVKRNRARFPDDFLFQLTDDEAKGLRSQFATSKEGRGGRRYRPFVFTEHGAIMAATVLNSKTAVEMSVFVVRAFVRLRTVLAAHEELSLKVSELEKRVDGHDESILAIVHAIKELMKPPVPRRKSIGFTQATGRKPVAPRSPRLALKEA